MENELKQLIIDAPDLEDINIVDIDSHGRLFNYGFGDGFNRRSGIWVGYPQKYNVKIEAEEDVLKIFFRFDVGRLYQINTGFKRSWTIVKKF